MLIGVEEGRKGRGQLKVGCVIINKYLTTWQLKYGHGENEEDLNIVLQLCKINQEKNCKSGFCTFLSLLNGNT